MFNISLQYFSVLVILVIFSCNNSNKNNISQKQNEQTIETNTIYKNKQIRDTLERVENPKKTSKTIVFSNRTKEDFELTFSSDVAFNIPTEEYMEDGDGFIVLSDTLVIQVFTSGDYYGYVLRTVVDKTLTNNEGLAVTPYWEAVGDNPYVSYSRSKFLLHPNGDIHRKVVTLEYGKLQVKNELYYCKNGEFILKKTFLNNTDNLMDTYDKTNPIFLIKDVSDLRSEKEVKIREGNYNYTTISDNIALAWNEGAHYAYLVRPNLDNQTLVHIHQSEIAFFEDKTLRIFQKGIAYDEYTIELIEYYREDEFGDYELVDIQMNMEI